MDIEHIVSGIVGQLAGRLLRRALLAIVVASLAIVALAYLTGAGMLALEAQYGALYAQLIMAGLYAAGALFGVIVWLVQSRPTSASATAVGPTQQMQLVMLVEAAMLGYALARGRERAP